jgi:hypothetical protein
MEYHPGRTILIRAAQELAAGRQVALLLRIKPQPLTITAIEEDGPLASCDDGHGGTILIRMDELVGLRVADQGSYGLAGW